MRVMNEILLRRYHGMRVRQSRATAGTRLAVDVYRGANSADYRYPFRAAREGTRHMVSSPKGRRGYRRAGLHDMARPRRFAFGRNVRRSASPRGALGAFFWGACCNSEQIENLRCVLFDGTSEFGIYNGTFEDLKNVRAAWN